METTTHTVHRTDLDVDDARRPAGHGVMSPAAVRNAHRCIGRVAPTSTKTLRAARITGTADDIRRVAFGFRTLDAAVAWIVKGGDA